MFLLPRSASKLFASSSSASTSAVPSAAELHSSAFPPDEYPSGERVEEEIAKLRMTESATRTAKDVKDWSDISRMQNEEDGSFKRKPSGFRNWIEKGGKFEPEKGM